MEERPEEILFPTQEIRPIVSKLVKVDNWGIFFLQQLHALFLKKEDCDFTLAFQSGNKIEVHRNVLNACTEFFKNLNIDGSTVLLPVEFTYDAFSAIVNFMYTGKLEFTDDIEAEMYSIAKVLKMSVLLKLLDAQTQNQDAVPKQILPDHTEKKKLSPIKARLSSLGTTTKVMKKFATNGKKISKTSTNINAPTTLPGKKLPIWKKRTVPAAPLGSLFTTNGIIKRNILNPAKPARFEWPLEGVEPTVPPDEFEDLCYDTQPLIKPNHGDVPYPSVADFDSKVNGVLKRSFVNCMTDYSSKEPRLDSIGDHLYSSEESNIAGDSSSGFTNNSCQIITSLDDDYDDSDIENDSLSIEDAPSQGKNDTSFLNRTPVVEGIPVSPVTSTPKPILKTVGTPSSSKKVRFSLEEKENTESIQRTVNSSEGIKSGNVIKQSNDIFNSKSVVVENSAVADKPALYNKPPESQRGLPEKDLASKKRAVGVKFSASENTNCEDNQISNKRLKIIENQKVFSESELCNTSTSVESTENATVAKSLFPAEDIREENPTKTAEGDKAFVIKEAVKEKKQAAKVPVTETKAPIVNHAKIVAEVLKKYPHLFNKNVRLKIMNPDGDRNSFTNIKINRPGNQPAPKVSKNAQFSVGNVSNQAGGDSIERKKNQSSSKEPVRGPWLCTPCGIEGAPMNFESYYDYHKHLIEIHCEKIDARTCEHCGQKFLKRNLLQHHLLVRHNILPPKHIVFPKCDQCNYYALTESLLIKHRKSHADNLDFKCKVCNALFKSSGALQGHMQTKLHLPPNESPKVHKCLHCDLEFNRNINLKAHIRNVHLKQHSETESVASNSNQMYSNVMIEQQSNEDKGCTLILPSGVTLVSDTQQVPLLPSSESEALNNVASGIATSIGLNDNLVNTETVILLNQGTEYYLQNSGQPGEYIVPEIMSDSNQIYTFQQKDQLEQVTTIGNLCTSVPTSVSQLISEDTIVTIDNSTNSYNTQFNVPISTLAERLNSQDNQLILLTLSSAEPHQKSSEQNVQNISVPIETANNQSYENLPVQESAPLSGFSESVAIETSADNCREVTSVCIESSQNNLPDSQSEILSSSSSEADIGGLSIDLVDSSSVNEPTPIMESHSGKSNDSAESRTEVDSSVMNELVRDWDEFSDEEPVNENEDDGKNASLPCRPTIGFMETDSYSL